VRIPVGPVAVDASIQIGIADPVLAGAIAASLTAALAAIEVPPLSQPTVLLRSRKRIAERLVELSGAIAIVGVTPRNARHLVAITDQLRAAGVAGIQLVWDGASHERHVFAALEHARSLVVSAPLVVAATIEPAPALRLLVAHRLRRTS
jgi:hypothetical protein